MAFIPQPQLQRDVITSCLIYVSGDKYLLPTTKCANGVFMKNFSCYPFETELQHQSLKDII